MHTNQTATLPKIPRRYASVLFALIMSLSLSAALSAAITAVNTGIDAGFLGRWLHAYALAWSFAFPAVTLLAPRVRTLVDRLTA
ncbi:DUF2798 domain-containing protein [Methylobacterium iners]|uniref:DUF2798 domain-containing protein n=1 Tax=Methylobacterium iners TaxID=418707 RepID=A0ABQ4RUG7_9HYPH|nr:DUF2798 domain-containing protein [Methylobacterium iners]GJD93617.1 hypothetical protein OCOJLMKI_0813 [Methylobacterium iners]